MHPIGQATTIVCIVLPVFATISVGLRFEARRIRKLPLLGDDWVILIALFATVAACILTAYGVIAKGLGLGPQELAALSPSAVEDVFKVFYAIMLLLYFTQGATKVSATLFFKRLFVSPRFHLAANIMLAAVIGWTISLFIIEALCSWKIVGFWNEKLLNYAAFNLSMAVLDFVFDLAILLLPLPVIKNLHIHKKRKYSLAGIFALGSIAVVASALRIYYCHEFLTFNLATSEERKTFISTSNSLWLAVEACVSIIAACLPTLSAFLRGRTVLKSRNSRYMFHNDSGRLAAPGQKRRGHGETPVEILAAEKRTWFPLRDLSNNTTTAEAMDVSSAESQTKLNRGITVERSFASESEAA